MLNPFDVRYDGRLKPEGASGRKNLLTSPSPNLPLSHSWLNSDKCRLRLRATAQLPACGVDRVALAVAEVNADAALLEDLAEGALGIVARRFLGQSGDRIVGNDVEDRGAASEQVDELGCFARAVVDTAQQDVFKRQLAAG